jgi:predicted metal-dependent phosphoesterase TrpH
VIDLHLHTTASDGLLPPASLVARAADAGLRIISVTDHDTVAGLADARRAAATRGLRLVDGIEITAIEDGRDVHVLGYFFDPEDRDLGAFLDRQRANRIERVREIGVRLRALNLAIDLETLLEAAAREAGRSVGRPLVADALVAAGHAVDRRDAFDRLLSAGGPAFVPRSGPPVDRVIDAIAAAGGIASLAHAGLTRVDARIPAFVDAGLSAIEVRHRDHDAATEARYRDLAQALGVAVSGGSDFHGLTERLENGVAAAAFGAVTLSQEDFARLEARRTHAAPRGASVHDVIPPR